MSYDGTDFRGWATQPGLRTVEGVLTDALSLIFRQPVSVTVAGRTDAGVHARRQTVHLDVDEAIWQSLPGRSQRSPGEALVDRLNSLLARGRHPKGTTDVLVYSAQVAPQDFDARFSATGRSYTYRIDDSALGNVFASRYVWRTGPLDLEAMRHASVGLLGERDFLSYCKPREGATTIRELRSIRIERPIAGSDAGLVTISLEADAFCHSMVRSIVGALVKVGSGVRPITWPEEILCAESRRDAAPLAPAHGLTLESVTYPADDLVGAQAAAARRVREKPATA